MIARRGPAPPTYEYGSIRVNPEPEPVGSAALSGNVITAAAGTIGVLITFALVGIASTGATGTIAPDRSVPVLGVSASGAAGTVTNNDRSAALTGQAVAVSPGNVGVSQPGQAALIGDTVPCAAGILSPDRSIDLTGIAITSAVGNVVPTYSRALTGVSSTADAGDLSTSPRLVGIAVTVSAGTITASVSVPLTGVSRVMLAGSVSQSQGVEVATPAAWIASAANQVSVES